MTSEAKPVEPSEEEIKAKMERREALIDELNILVTTLGPRLLHRGVTLDEAYEAILDCVKHLQRQLLESEERRRLLEEQIEKYAPKPPVACEGMEGVPI